MEEIWKTIPDFPDYSASTHGRIRRDARGKSTQAGKILKPVAGEKTKEGEVKRWYVSLMRDGKKYNRAVHRLVLEAHIGPRPKRLECCHADGNPANNRLENIRWDTSRANSAEMVKHGMSTRGSKSRSAKLTEGNVREIKRSLARFSGIGACVKLARQFGVHNDTISRIKRGKNMGVGSDGWQDFPETKALEKSVPSF